MKIRSIFSLLVALMLYIYPISALTAKEGSDPALEKFIREYMEIGLKQGRSEHEVAEYLANTITLIEMIRKNCKNQIYYSDSHAQHLLYVYGKTWLSLFGGRNIDGDSSVSIMNNAKSVSNKIFGATPSLKEWCTESRDLGIRSFGLRELFIFKIKN